MLSEIATAFHTTTHAQVIRRFLLLREGDFCDELRRADSERILRAQPFIADVAVRVLTNIDGGVDLDVDTSDEIAIVLDGGARSGFPPIQFIRLGDSNLSGAGIYFAGQWRRGFPFRDGYGARFVDYQMLGRPYTFRAEGNQTPLGSDWLIDATHPF